MKPVKLAAGVMMPVMFLHGSRHPHVEGHAFAPEPQPANPFVVFSTATVTTTPMLLELSDLQGPKKFKVTL